MLTLWRVGEVTQYMEEDHEAGAFRATSTFKSEDDTFHRCEFPLVPLCTSSDSLPFSSSFPFSHGPAALESSLFLPFLLFPEFDGVEAVLVQMLRRADLTSPSSCRVSFAGTFLSEGVLPLEVVVLELCEIGRELEGDELRDDLRELEGDELRDDLRELEGEAAFELLPLLLLPPMISLNSIRERRSSESSSSLLNGTLEVAEGAMLVSFFFVLVSRFILMKLVAGKRRGTPLEVVKPFVPLSSLVTLEDCSCIIFYFPYPPEDHHFLWWMCMFDILLLALHRYSSRLSL